MNTYAMKKRVNELIDLMASKNADYGSDNITFTGVHGVSVRLTDKVHRLVNLTKDGMKTPNYESLEDTFKDVINYALIGLALLDGSWDSTPVNAVYLAGPIDEKGAPSTWRRTAADLLAEHGVGCFTPYGAYYLPMPSGKVDDVPDDVADFVVRVNMYALRAADAVIAYVPRGFRSYGTITEINLALGMGKPVFIWTADSEGLESLSARGLACFPSLQDVVDHMWGMGLIGHEQTARIGDSV